MVEKKRARGEANPKSSVGRTLAFVILAGAVSGYLLLKARSESSSPPLATSSPQETEAKPLEAGRSLPTVSLLSLAGERLELRSSQGSRPVLLYIFSPTCSICTENLSAWKELALEAESHGVEVLGISVLDPARTADYVRQKGLPWKVYCAGGREAIDALGVERVPLTLVLEAGGRVRLAVQGQLDSGQKTAVSQAFRKRPAAG